MWTKSAALALAATLISPAVVYAQDSIKIGDINSYKLMAISTIHYKRGAELAIDQINAAGGVLGMSSLRVMTAAIQARRSVEPKNLSRATKSRCSRGRSCQMSVWQ